MMGKNQIENEGHGLFQARRKTTRNGWKDTTPGHWERRGMASPPSDILSFSGKQTDPGGCADLSVLGLVMETNMKADLCIHTLENDMAA